MPTETQKQNGSPVTVTMADELYPPTGGGVGGDGLHASLTDLDSSGHPADQLAVANSPTNYTPDGATVEGHLLGVDDAIGAALANEGNEAALIRCLFDFSTMTDGLAVPQGATSGTMVPLQALAQRSDVAPGAQTSQVTDGLLRTHLLDENLDANTDALQGLIIPSSAIGPSGNDAMSAPISGRLTMAFGGLVGLGSPSGWGTDMYVEVMTGLGQGWNFAVIYAPGEYPADWAVQLYHNEDAANIVSVDLPGPPDVGQTFWFEWDRTGYITFGTDDTVLWSGDASGSAVVPTDDLAIVGILTTSFDVTDESYIGILWAAYTARGVALFRDMTVAGVDTFPTLSDATPEALGTAAAGSSTGVARSDHVHDMPTAAAVGAVPREPVVTTVGATGATETLTIDGSVDAYVLTMDEACAVTPTGGVEGVTVLVWVSGAFTLSWVGVTVDSGTVPDYVSGSLYAITYLAGAYRLALIGSGFAAP